MQTEQRDTKGRGGQDGDPIIQMRNIVKIFKTPAGDFPALGGGNASPLNVDFYEGEFVSVVGRSGSGKSTLANMITGIDHPSAGEVIVMDAEIHQMNESQRSRWRGRSLGIVFQFYQLLPMLTLLENVMLPMDFCDMYEPAMREIRAAELLAQVGLADVMHEMPSAVSGGQQQCAAVARALANDPPIIVADEPTGNLDTRAADVVFGIFEALAERGKTIVMVTHDTELAHRASRCLRIADGAIVADEIVSARRAEAKAATAPVLGPL
ncbi:MAG: ABC transporter ATP-binding protein [Anaerolineae bacterium]